MEHLILTAPSFDLTRSIDFLRTFPPCRGEFVLGDDRLAGAFDVGDRTVPWSVRATAGPASRARTPGLVVTSDDARVVPMVRAFLGVDDAMESFYAKAASDAPAYRELVTSLRGLHHVRFPTLAEATVHAVLAQRTPIALASKQKRQVAAALGTRVAVDGQELVAFPTLDRLADLEPSDWREIIGNAPKSERLTEVVRGVRWLGEAALRTVPYGMAYAQLLDIRGLGPFSVAFILFRGLGRGEEMDLDIAGIADVARHVYGPGWDATATRRRYGSDIGSWSYYLKAGAGAASRARTKSCLAHAGAAASHDRRRGPEPRRAART